MDNTTFYQLHIFEKDFPIFISIDFSLHSEDLAKILEEQHFIKSSEEKMKEHKEKEHYRTIRISPAGPRSKASLLTGGFLDRYGKESITPRGHHKLYKYQQLALTIFSLDHPEWEMGVLPSFGTADSMLDTKIIINRYLSWSLLPMNIFGLWANYSQEYLIVTNAQESFGEAVFWDTSSSQIQTSDAAVSTKQGITIIRPDQTKTKHGVKLSREELLSFLSYKTTHFDYNPTSRRLAKLLKQATLNSICHQIAIEFDQESENRV